MDMKTCTRCKQSLPLSKFLSINNLTFPDGRVDICTSCLNDIMRAADNNWEVADRICQWIGIPFIPDNWVKSVEAFGEEAIEIYVKMYKDGQFDFVDWKEAYNYYKDLERAGVLNNSVATISKAELTRLKQKWGEHYDEEQIRYLEHLYQSIINDYGIAGNTQLDTIMKYCKVSLNLEEKIRGDEDVDKAIRSLDNLRKIANLEPKNIKDAADFNSVGEIFAYLEKTNWLNDFYDGVDRDIVDKTMKDIQNWCRYLYVNESSIPEDIQNRLEALKIAEDMEDELNKIEDDGLDDMEGFELEEFNPEAGVE